MANDKRTVASKDGTCISTDGTCRRSATAHSEKTAIRYIIKKNGKRYNSKTYESYEQARSYVRKKLREVSGELAAGPDWSLRTYSNPSHSFYGFSITKV